MSIQSTPPFQPNLSVKLPVGSSSPPNSFQNIESLGPFSTFDTIQNTASTNILPQLSFRESLPAVERVERAVQDLWNAHKDTSEQAAILNQFQQDLNATAADTVTSTYLYTEEELVNQEQVLQGRIEKIQQRLDDGTPDCGGGMQQELTACQLAQHGIQQALQLRYLTP